MLVEFGQLGFGRRAAPGLGNAGEHIVPVAQRIDLDPFRRFRIHETQRRPEQKDTGRPEDDVLALRVAALLHRRRDLPLVRLEFTRDAGAIERAVGRVGRSDRPGLAPGAAGKRDGKG